MEDNYFRKRIEENLIGRKREDVVYFAWTCAVRCLPFLVKDSDFNFWKKEHKQKHLYAIFKALDYAYVANAHNYSIIPGAEAGAAAADAANTDAAATADAATYAAAAVPSASASASDATVTFAYTYAAVATNKLSFLSNKKYLNLLIRESKIIKKDSKFSLINEIYDTKNLNKINEFLTALRKNDCHYWADLYEQIFKEGCIIDEPNSNKLNTKEALAQRLNVPEEIKAKGAAAVSRFLIKLRQGSKRLNEARIIILGKKGAGKTCLARRLIKPNAKMTEEKESTPGVDTSLWKIEDHDMNAHIWDFAGHTVTHAVHRFFLSERCLYVIVYDGRTEDNENLKYWLQHLNNYGGNSEAIIVVNKRDKHKPDIPVNTLSKKYAIYGEVEYFSIDDVAAIKSFRQKIADYIINKPFWNLQAIPTTYYDVKEELETLFEKNDNTKNKEHIELNEFKQIAKRNGVEDLDSLLSDLHDLGIVLHYKKIEHLSTLVLNPEWISDGVYKIINWVHDKGKHELSEKDCPAIFEDCCVRYPKEKYQFLFELMKEYELAFETNDATKKMVIPHLLDEDEPAVLPVFEIEDSLKLKYEANHPLPPNTVSRFIVRFNKNIQTTKGKPVFWRFGVVLNDGKGTTALVKEDDRTLSVSVKGKNRTKYLDDIREALNEIFNSYKSENPERRYLISGFGDGARDILANRKEIWLSELEIINHQKHNEAYYDSVNNRKISLDETAKNYNIQNALIIQNNDHSRRTYGDKSSLIEGDNKPITAGDQSPIISGDGNNISYGDNSPITKVEGKSNEVNIANSNPVSEGFKISSFLKEWWVGRLLAAFGIAVFLGFGAKYFLNLDFAFVAFISFGIAALVLLSFGNPKKKYYNAARMTLLTALGLMAFPFSASLSFHQNWKDGFLKSAFEFGAANETLLIIIAFVVSVVLFIIAALFETKNNV